MTASATLRSVGYRWIILIAVASQLGACASLPPPSAKSISTAIPASKETDLGLIATKDQPFPEASGFRLLRSGSAALDARIVLIARTQRSIDVQYYHFDTEGVGARVVDELRAAAKRGVRVRLLVDDLHTFRSDLVLLALSKRPNVEVRLFNPIVTSRGPLYARLLSSFWDFQRVNARMHNKLLVADGAMAIVGGRNIADAYFDPPGGSAYLDLDVLVAGAVVADLGRTFDAYWNSDIVYPVGDILSDTALPDSVDAPEEAFGPSPTAPRPLRETSPESLEQRIQEGSLQMAWGWAEAFADAPEKSRGQRSLISRKPISTASQMRELIWSEMAQARSEYLILTPYLVPGTGGMRTVRANRSRGVRISIVTNSLASTDEPLVHSGYRRYRREMLEEGVELYELGADRGWYLSGSKDKQQLHGLHTKCVVFDRDTVYLGSLNFDPRSESINTEAGLLIRSHELADEILDFVEDAKRKALYKVVLTPTGKLAWDATAWEQDPPELGNEPKVSAWRRFWVELLAPFVPESLL